ncbi:MAG: O-antigen ligase family protein [Pseudonocardiaceae bacterium]
MTTPTTQWLPTRTGWLHTHQGAAYLAILVASLFVLPSNVVIGAVGGNGSPARLLSLAAVGLLLTAWIRPGRDRQPMTVDPGIVGLIVFLAWCFVSFAVAKFRLLEVTERTGATRALLTLIAFTGVALFAAVMLRRRDDIDRVVMTIAVGGSFSALIGVIQSRVPFDYATTVLLPGFAISIGNIVDTRNDFIRVIGTSINPIEFGVVMGAIAPFGLHLAIYGRTKRQQQLGKINSVLCIGAAPLAVSRSAVLSLAISLIVYAITLTGQQRLKAVVVGIVGTMVYQLIQPGLLGTIKGLFLHANEDSSIAARTEDYPAIFALADQSLWFGRGLGTFRPDVYFFLDNQWLLTFVESGITGVLAMFAVFLSAVLLVQGARRRSADAPSRSLCQAVLGGVVAFAVSAYTFDMLSFQQVTLLTGLYVGLACALRASAVAGTLEDESCLRLSTEKNGPPDGNT